MICDEDPLRRRPRESTARRKRQERCVWMARKMTEWPSKRGPITKIMPSDGCIGDTVPLAVGKWYDFHEFGWYITNLDGILRIWMVYGECRLNLLGERWAHRSEIRSRIRLPLCPSLQTHKIRCLLSRQSCPVFEVERKWGARSSIHDSESQSLGGEPVLKGFPKPVPVLKLTAIKR